VDVYRERTQSTRDDVKPDRLLRDDRGNAVFEIEHAVAYARVELRHDRSFGLDRH
jgi:hypothetical protein